MGTYKTLHKLFDMKRILMIALIIASFYLYGQIPEIQWQKCYGTTETNESFGVINTDNGYLLALGAIDGEGLPNYHGGGDI